MLAAKTELKKAQTVKEFLAKRKLIHPDFLTVKEFGFIYFPLLKKMSLAGAEIVNTKFSFPEKEKRLGVEELLQDKLTALELKSLPKSQEIVGKIMILEIPLDLQKKERVIAEAYLKANKYIETVVRKEEIHSGEFRLRKVKILAGKKSKETIHQESGIKLKLELENTYFSARSGHERLRIAEQVKKGEEVLVMFSGAGPYPLVIAKNSPAKMVYGIEINPFAHQYALENVALNNLSGKINLYLGDVNKVMPKMDLKFDRIVMPLPKTGEDFLPLALTKIKKNGMIHLYAFLSEEEIKSKKIKIKTIIKKEKKSVKILRAVKCGQFAPSIFRVCFDLRIV